MKLLLVTLFTLLLSVNVFAATNSNSSEEKKEKIKVRYKKGGRIDFESLLIEGESKKPEMSVVIGNIGEKDTGLLRFRKDFTDMMARDFGESAK